jgi:CubicO group peptidase (beta-lactamase class C family)
MRNALVPLVAAAALLVGMPAAAQDKTPGSAPESIADRAGQIDEIFRWATAATPGGVVAVSQNGKVVVNRAYGSADLERGAPMRLDAVFDIGSLRKQFIAAAVLLLAEDGRLSLSDDVRKHVPELPTTATRSRSTTCSPTPPASATGPGCCRWPAGTPTSSP